MLLCWPKLHPFLPLDKVEEALGLVLESVGDFGVFEDALGVEQVVDSWQENPFGIEQSVAIAKDHLELLDRAQRAPHPGAQSDEADRLLLEALGELEHVDEILHHTGQPAVVFRR